MPDIITKTLQLDVISRYTGGVGSKVEGDLATADSALKKTTRIASDMAIGVGIGTAAVIGYGVKLAIATESAATKVQAAHDISKRDFAQYSTFVEAKNESLLQSHEAMWSGINAAIVAGFGPKTTDVIVTAAAKMATALGGDLTTNAQILTGALKALHTSQKDVLATTNMIAKAEALSGKGTGFLGGTAGRLLVQGGQAGMSPQEVLGLIATIEKQNPGAGGGRTMGTIATLIGNLANPSSTLMKAVGGQRRFESLGLDLSKHSLHDVMTSIMTLPPDLIRKIVGSGATVGTVKSLLTSTPANLNDPGFLNRAYAKDFGTFDSQMKELNLEMKDMAETIGVGILPVLKDGIPVVRGLMDHFRDFSKMIGPENLAKIGLGIGAIGVSAKLISWFSTLFGAGKGVAGSVLGRESAVMNVKAAVVNVYGGAGGGGNVIQDVEKGGGLMAWLTGRRLIAGQGPMGTVARGALTAGEFVAAAGLIFPAAMIIADHYYKAHPPTTAKQMTEWDTGYKTAATYGWSKSHLDALMRGDVTKTFGQGAYAPSIEDAIKYAKAHPIGVKFNIPDIKSQVAHNQVELANLVKSGKAVSTEWLKSHPISLQYAKDLEKQKENTQAAKKALDDYKTTIKHHNAMLLPDPGVYVPGSKIPGGPGSSKSSLAGGANAHFGPYPPADLLPTIKTVLHTADQSYAANFSGINTKTQTFHGINIKYWKDYQEALVGSSIVPDTLKAVQKVYGDAYTKVNTGTKDFHDKQVKALTDLQTQWQTYSDKALKVFQGIQDASDTWATHVEGKITELIKFAKKNPIKVMAAFGYSGLGGFTSAAGGFGLRMPGGDVPVGGDFGIAGASWGPGSLAASGIPNAATHMDWHIPAGTPFALPGGKKARWRLVKKTNVPGIGDWETWQSPNGGLMDFMHMEKMGPQKVGQIVSGGTIIGLSGGTIGGPGDQYDITRAHSSGAHLHSAEDQAALAYIYSMYGPAGMSQYSGGWAYGPGSGFGGAGGGKRRGKKKGHSGGINWDKVPAGVRRWQKEIMAASRATGMPPLLIAAVIQQESSGNPGETSGPPEDPTRDRGLMQVSYGSYDPGKNIMQGCTLLMQYKRKYGSWEKALDAYNGGDSPQGIANAGYTKTDINGQMISGYGEAVLMRDTAYGGLGMGTSGSSAGSNMPPAVSGYSHVNPSWWNIPAGKSRQYGQTVALHRTHQATKHEMWKEWERTHPGHQAGEGTSGGGGSHKVDAAVQSTARHTSHSAQRLDQAVYLLGQVVTLLQGSGDTQAIDKFGGNALLIHSG